MIGWTTWRGSIFSKYGGVWQGPAGSGGVEHTTKKTRYINTISKRLGMTPFSQRLHEIYNHFELHINADFKRKKEAVN